LERNVTFSQATKRVVEYVGSMDYDEASTKVTMATGPARSRHYNEWLASHEVESIEQSLKGLSLDVGGGGGGDGDGDGWEVVARPRSGSDARPLVCPDTEGEERCPVERVSTSNVTKV
jgi:hypothetical protein